MSACQFTAWSQTIGAASENWVTIYTTNAPAPLQTNLFDLLGMNRAMFYRIRAVREQLIG
jgi:hypothetical protein